MESFKAYTGSVSLELYPLEPPLTSDWRIEKFENDGGHGLDSFVMMESVDSNEGTFEVVDGDGMVVRRWKSRVWNVERGARILSIGSRKEDKSPRRRIKEQAG